MKKILKYFFIILILILIYILLLVLVSIIPKKLIEKNVKKSLNEPVYFDKFTDAIMIDIAYRINEKKPLESCLKDNVISGKNGIDGNNNNDNFDPNEALYQEFLNEKNEKYNYSYDYGRYWHGYLIYLRPLLVFLDFSKITILDGIILFILLLVLEIEIYKKISLKMALAFLLCFLSIEYFTLWINLNTFFTIFTAMIFSIVLIKKIDKINDICLFFIIDGSVTCFLNYWTFNIITLGLPLIIYYLLQDDCSLKKFIKIIFLYTFSYLITWVTKWVLVDLLYNTKILNDGFNQIFYRAGNKVTDYGIVNSLFSILINFKYISIQFFIEYYIIILFILITSRKNLKEFFNNLKSKKNLIFFIIGLMPFAVYAIIINHSVVHCRVFTYRLLILTEISMFVIANNAVEKTKENIKNSSKC